jgi:NAD(P)-dependent dehydrogenase (short-subunit alcohol dehydrogenase family)
MSAQPTQKPVCAVVGVGPGNGAAFARRFAAEGYAVALLARTTSLTSRLAQELPLARAYACDAGDPATVERTFEAIESDLGSVDVLIYNAGKGVWGSAEEVTFEDFEAAWRTNTFGAFATARSVIPAMKRRAAGHIIFVRRDRFAPRRRQDGGICFGQGGSAQSGRIPRPFARAIEDPCLADHH